MDDPKAFGYSLADGALALVRDEGARGRDTAALFAREVKARAEQMEAEGISPHAIAEWIGCVTDAYSERIHDLVRSMLKN